MPGGAGNHCAYYLHTGQRAVFCRKLLLIRRKVCLAVSHAVTVLSLYGKCQSIVKRPLFQAGPSRNTEAKLVGVYEFLIFFRAPAVIQPQMLPRHVSQHVIVVIMGNNHVRVL